MEIVRVPLLRDNYAWLLHQGELTAVVDPSRAGPVLAEVRRRGWRLTHIVNTHHHWDHTGGNRELAEATGARVVGPKADRDRIPGIDLALGDEERWDFGGVEATVLEIPGHTRGHVAFFFAEPCATVDAGAPAPALLCGDTLFSLGCGRLFEGTPAQMWQSLCRLRALPDTTLVCCGHEYTESNARFALSVEPSNPVLLKRAREVAALRRAGRPTVPSTIGDERAANPFLRADDPELQAAVGMKGADPVDVFAEVRARKDRF